MVDFCYFKILISDTVKDSIEQERVAHLEYAPLLNDRAHTLHASGSDGQAKKDLIIRNQEFQYAYDSCNHSLFLVCFLFVAPVRFVLSLGTICDCCITTQKPIQAVHAIPVLSCQIFERIVQLSLDASVLLHAVAGQSKFGLFIYFEMLTE